MEKRLIIVGLSGYAGSGKDTAAEALVEEGFERIAFADVLRDMALAIDPIVEYELGHARLRYVIDTFGWDHAKNTFPDVRRLLQRLGTEAGRNILGENIWVDTAFSRANGDKVVVTDVRFPNEANAIRGRGGLLVRIHRPGVGPKNSHASETSLDNFPFDYHVDNDGTQQELHELIKELLT